MGRRRRLLIALALACGCLGACKRERAASVAKVRVGEAELEVLLTPGWQAARLAEDDAVVLRIVREDAVLGSPRVEVAVEAPSSPRATLEKLRNRSLHDLTRLERGGGIRIASVIQKKLELLGVPAYRLHHDYTVVAGGFSVTQISWLFVHQGHAVVLSAAGRTELMTPLAPEIEEMVASISMPATSIKTVPLEPIDLGQLGETPP